MFTDCMLNAKQMNYIIIYIESDLIPTKILNIIGGRCCSIIGYIHKYLYLYAINCANDIV